MTAEPARATLARALTDLGESATALPARSAERVPLPSALPVPELAEDSVATASMTAALLHADRFGRLPATTGSGRRIAAAYSSERWFTLDGVHPDAWAPLSGFWPTAEGWLRTHGNYPHHAARLRSALDLDGNAGAEAVRDRLRFIAAADAAERIVAAGGIAAVVADPAPAVEEAIAQAPLLERRAHPAPPRTWTGGGLPLSGIRVLDLTRVIAGPVATRTLALFGADVLRIDSPRLPEIPLQHLDTGSGKRSALLDLTDPGDRAGFDALLAGTDVLVLGYRPSAMTAVGLDPMRLLRTHPGIVIAELSAWGFTDGAAGRRGFDSIVQAASGISWLESVDGSIPGALPAQALDHSAGYLLAAGIMSALRRQRAEGGSHRVRTSLRRVAAELLTLPASPRADAGGDLADQTIAHAGAAGLVRSVLPAPGYDGSPSDFSHPPHPLGTDAAQWLPR